MTLWPAFQTRTPVNLSTVLEVDPSTGAEVLVQDDLPGGRGTGRLPDGRAAITLDLAAGAARLLVLRKTDVQ